MRRFVSPYKKYIGWAILLNILSAVFNVFSFTLLIPILDILFKTGENNKVYEYMEWGTAGFKDVAINNFYYYVSQMIQDNGPTTALIFLGLFLALMTLFKTSCYFASSAVMIPLRTGVVRDIRIMVYAKVMRLPMGFFSEERKGDIIARMSGDAVCLCFINFKLIFIHTKLLNHFHKSFNCKGIMLHGNAKLLLCVFF